MSCPVVTAGQTKGWQPGRLSGFPSEATAGLTSLHVKSKLTRLEAATGRLKAEGGACCMLKAGQNDLHHPGQRQVKAQKTTGKSYAQALRAGLPKVGADLARAAAARLSGRQLQREQYVRLGPSAEDVRILRLTSKER